MSISERIVYIQQQEGISASKFADLLGVQRSGLSHIYSGRNKPSIDFLQKLSIQFPQYRLEWIINGIEPILYVDKAPEKAQEPDLFNQMVSNEVRSENKAEYGLKSTTNKNKKQLVDLESNDQEIPEREILKVMLIYSDNTFKVLDPQNHK